MSTPPETNKSDWVLPGLILWGFTPAILLAASMIGGTDSYAAGFGALFSVVGLLGMPFVLYPWSVTVLARNGMTRPKSLLVAVPVGIVMCAVNIFAGATGCAVLSRIVPKEGIF